MANMRFTRSVATFCSQNRVPLDNLASRSYWRRLTLTTATLHLRTLTSTTTAMMAAATPNDSKTVTVVAVAQLCSTANKARNLQHVAYCAGRARQENACMLFLPECFGFMGQSAAETLQHAERPLDQASSQSNPDQLSHALVDIVRNAKLPEETLSIDTEISILDGLSVIAQESGLWISGGGMHVGGAPAAPDDADAKPRVYNTHVIVDKDGKLRCYYHKIHLFDLDIPGQVTLRESTSTAPGTELVTCPVDALRMTLGLSTCYDLRFPEQYTKLVESMGAQILLVPSAFTVPTGRAHWHTLLRARAIETQCYVIAAAQFGTHNAKRESYGHSLVVDPWGVVLADAGGVDGGPTGSTMTDNAAAAAAAAAPEPPSIVVAQLDPSLVQTTRQRMPVSQHRASATI